MSINVAIDVVLGLVFIYLLYSLLATIISEIIAQLFDLRAKMLVKAIRTLLEDREDKKQNGVSRFLKSTGENIYHFFKPFPSMSLTKAFYKHPAIKYLGSGIWRNKTSYISPATFSGTLIQMLRGVDYAGTEPQMNAIYRTLFEKEQVFARIEGEAEQVKLGPETLEQLRQLYINAQQDIDRFKILIENWFNETMDRSSEWFKKQTQLILGMVGLFIAIAFNADSIAITNILANDESARRDMVQLAINATGSYDSTISKIRPADTFYRQITDSSGVIIDSVMVIRDTAFINLNREELKKASETVREDIDKANSIMGLGWPDKDSCRLCDSIQQRLSCCDIDSTERSLLSLKKEQYVKRFSCNGNPYQHGGWVTFLGWILTALAISLGAPFWFDLLNKIIQLRTSVNKHSNVPGNSNNTVTPGRDNSTGVNPDNRVG